MAEIIPDQILDAALKDIANFSDAEARAEIDRISIVQPALVEYFIAMTEDSSEDVQSFASAMFVAIHKVFEKLSPFHWCSNFRTFITSAVTSPLQRL